MTGRDPPVPVPVILLPAWSRISTAHSDSAPARAHALRHSHPSCEHGLWRAFHTLPEGG